MTITFQLTPEEAKVAAARAAWRAALGGGLLARHVAPLVAFVLALLFAAVLGWTGLVSRRAADIALVGAATLYMIHRLWARRRFFAAKRSADAWAETLRAGPIRLSLEDVGFEQEAQDGRRAWRFEDGLDIETVGDLVYAWPRQGAPLVWPRRADVGVDEAQVFLALARRLKAAPRPAKERATSP